MTKKKKPGLPANKPIPRFKSYAEEVKFWEQYELEDDETGWEPVEYVPHSTRHPRQHVYRVRFDDLEMASLQALAKKRGLPASTVVRELVTSALANDRRTKKRRAG